MNDNFKSAPKSQKLQHIVEAINIPGQNLVLFSSYQTIQEFLIAKRIET